MTGEFECDLCAGELRVCCGAGRHREFRAGIELEIPKDFPVLTCMECGELYLSAQESAELEKAQEPAYARYVAELIDTVMGRAQVTLREVEKACALTPTYLSHVRSGRKQPSLVVVRLLQSFARHPEEVKRHLKGEDWRTSDTWSTLISFGTAVIRQAWEAPKQECQGELPEPLPGMSAA